MRRTYLQENNTLLYNHLVLTEQLFPHLWEIQDTASARIEQIMQELLEKNPAPDKRTDQMGWVQHMNVLKNPGRGSGSCRTDLQLKERKGVTK